MTNNDYTDLLQLRNGSEAAFERLFNRYSGKLYNFIFRLSSGNTFLTEEMVQRAFIKVWETHQFIDPEKTFISYLCTIAKNMLLNEYEHQTVEFIYQQHVCQEQSEEDYVTEKTIDYHLLEDFIDRLTEKLPPARKKIFVMHRMEQLSVKEIAVRLNLAESTVQNQLSKALQFMKENLMQYYQQIIILILLNFS